jgi:drug/metabolite transporter (DMT)-like permease
MIGISLNKPERHGILLASGGAFCFAAMSFIVHCEKLHFPASEIAFFRALLNAIFLIPWVGKQTVVLVNKKSLFLWGRSGLAAGSALCFFFTLQNGSVGLALVLFQLAPFFVIILSWYFLRERIFRTEWICFVSVALGTILYDLGESLDGHAPTVLIGVLGALMAAAAMLSLRKVTLTYSPKLIVFTFSVTTVFISVLFFRHEWQLPAIHDFPAIVAVGIFGLYGQLLFTEAFAVTRAAVISIVGLSEIIFGVGLDSIIHPQHRPDAIGFLGVFFLIVGISSLHFLRRPPKETDSL